VVGMPALSPTMDSGTISSWNVSEGESFSAGDSLAEIETDKATMDFEAQDEGVVAKILVEAQSGDIAVGAPVIVTVEDEDDVAAFKDFVPPETENTAADPVAEVEQVEVKTEVAAVKKVETPPPPPPAATAAAVETPPPPATDEAEIVGTTIGVPISPSWGNFARDKSPLARTLSKNQKKYIEMFGSTGQIPLCDEE